MTAALQGPQSNPDADVKTLRRAGAKGRRMNIAIRDRAALRMLPWYLQHTHMDAHRRTPGYRDSVAHSTQQAQRQNPRSGGNSVLSSGLTLNALLGRLRISRTPCAPWARRLQRACIPRRGVHEQSSRSCSSDGLRMEMLRNWRAQTPDGCWLWVAAQHAACEDRV